MTALGGTSRADVTYSIPTGQTHQVYWTYDYDADTADQLKSAKAYSDSGRSSAIAGRQFTYTFDGIGKRTDKSYQPNAANQYTRNPDAANATITYNPRGDLTFDGVFTYTYDSADRLTSATPADHAAHPYKMEAGYDDQGRRIWKKSYQWDTRTNGWQLSEYRKFVYDGWNLVAVFSQDPRGLDKLIRTYAWGQDLGGGIGGLLSITTYQSDGVTPDKTYLPLYDASGNVTGLADAATGNVVATYEYDPFGNPLAAYGDQAALNANPFRFSTKYFDAETGLYYYGYRYYSPQLGRWMTRDPLQEAGARRGSARRAPRRLRCGERWRTILADGLRGSDLVRKTRRPASGEDFLLPARPKLATDFSHLWPKISTYGARAFCIESIGLATLYCELTLFNPADGDAGPMR